ncbi:MAG: hemerythrin domain-containing protein [Beijerinckiaceae bacterium]
MTEKRLDDSLLFLARQHPRPWAGNPQLGELARFWLQRHDFFRRLDALIRETTDAAVAGQVDPDRYNPWAARHLQLFLGQLEEHHMIEDHNYFLLFRRAEPRLARGFDILDRDHALVHGHIHALADAANAFLAAPQTDADQVRDLIGRFRAAYQPMGRDLVQHLADEEDLIVPLLIDRGEGAIVGA